MMRFLKFFMLLAVLLLTFGLTACEDEGPLEKAGEKVDEAGEEIGEAAEEAKEEVED